jgi:hypothetical protein
MRVTAVTAPKAATAVRAVTGVTRALQASVDRPTERRPASAATVVPAVRVVSRVLPARLGQAASPAIRVPAGPVVSPAPQVPAVRADKRVTPAQAGQAVLAERVAQPVRAARPGSVAVEAPTASPVVTV